VTPWVPATFCESGPTNQNATYVAAFNPSAGEFLQDGTVIGIQLGNEILGPQSAATITTAAQNRIALNAAGFSNVKVIVSLVEGQASTFCSGGAPPTGVDYIADTSTAPPAVQAAWPVRRLCGQAGIPRRKPVGRRCREYSARIRPHAA
jgi:hypothetical protein